MGLGPRKGNAPSQRAGRAQFREVDWGDGMARGGGKAKEVRPGNGCGHVAAQRVEIEGFVGQQGGVRHQPDPPGGIVHDGEPGDRAGGDAQRLPQQGGVGEADRRWQPSARCSWFRASTVE